MQISKCSELIFRGERLGDFILAQMQIEKIYEGGPVIGVVRCEMIYFN